MTGRADVVRVALPAHLRTLARVNGEVELKVSGQVYGSADAGDNWTSIVSDLPAVLSVELQTLP